MSLAHNLGRREADKFGLQREFYMELVDRLRSVEDRLTQLEMKHQSQDIFMEEMRTGIMSQLENFDRLADTTHNDLKDRIESVHTVLREHIADEVRDRKMFTRTMSALIVTMLLGMGGYILTFIAEHGH